MENQKGNLTDVFMQCLQTFQTLAAEKDFASRDAYLIPELVGYGREAMLWYLNNEKILEDIGDSGMYYYVAVNTAFRCGIAFAEDYRENPELCRTQDYVTSCLSRGIAAKSEPVIREKLGKEEAEFGHFCLELYNAWAELEKPWLEDEENGPAAVFQGIMAAFQLGVSVLMSNYEVK